MIVELIDFAPDGTPEPEAMGDWHTEAIDGLRNYWESTSVCSHGGEPHPCRLEFHSLPDGTEVIARFDCRGEIWKSLHITP